jgi:apolipoprotein N-acyltransferase
MKRAWLQKDILVAILSGALFATSYPPFPAWALFFCFAPIWTVYYRTQSLKRVAILSFINQFVFTLIGFNWIAHTAIEYGHIPTVFSYLILFGFCCFASLNVFIATLISHFLLRRFKFTAAGFFITIAVLSASMEWFYPRIFSWNMGYALLFSHFKSSQLAEFTGFNILSLLINLSSSCFALSWIRFPRAGWSRPLITFIILLFAAENLGTLASKNLGIEDKKINVMMVQPNIGNYDKLYAEKGPGFQAPVVKKDLEVTELGLRESLANGHSPDLIVWPETAYPVALDPYFEKQYYPQKLLHFAKDHKVKMIVGAFSADSPSNSLRPKDYNAVFAINENGEVIQSYRKHVLLAFGEYFPGAEYFPFLKNIVPEISDFGRGTGPANLKFLEVSFEPLICYEGLDTSFVGDSIRLNPNIFVNLTNDSWFGTTFEPYQHMIMTIARTIEFRRPMIRATNTGFSVLASARGEILVQSPQEKEWAQTTALPYFSNPKDTIYSKIYPYLSLIFLTFSLGTIAAAIRWNENAISRT